MISLAIAFNHVEPSFLQCYLWFMRQANADELALDPRTDLDMEKFLKDENQSDDKRRQKDSQYEPNTS